MKMDALNFLKKTDKKKTKKNVKRKSSVQTPLHKPVNLSNPWVIFTMVDKNVFTQVIDDFVKKAKWRRQKTRKSMNKSKHSNLELPIDLETIDYESIDNVLNKVSWNSPEIAEKEEDIQINKMLAEIDIEYIKMFYSLRMFVPWYTAIHFLKEYADDNRGMLAPELYKFYLDTPDMIKLKTETNQFLQNRVAKTAGITSKELNNPTFIKIFTDFNNTTKISKYIYPPPCVKAVQTKIDNKYTVVGKDYDPLILKNKQVIYRDLDMIDTSWLHEYGIKGFVISEKNNILATPIEVRYNNKIWYKVNKLFYKHLYTERRNFIPGLIGYIMQDSSIVIETLEIFERLKQYFEMKETKSRINAGYETAIYMIKNDVLLNNVYTVKELASFASKIVESFKPCYNTKEIAKKLSFILVYYRKLVTVEQSYVENTKKKMYAPEKLLNLTKDVLLPEVYSLPDTDPDKKRIVASVGSSIAQIRREIETEFYIQLESKVLPEEGRIRVRSTNVTTKVQNTSQLVQGDKFAPGLIQKLKTLITVIPLTKCSLCDTNVYNLSYKSVYSGEIKTFCNQECFENFKFKK